MADTKQTAQQRVLSAATYAGMLVFGVVMALLGAVLPTVSARLGFDLAQTGQLFLVMNFCMLVCSLGVGPAMDRFGMKAPMALGPLAVGGALLMVASAPSFHFLLAAVALLGLGGGALNGSTNTLVADLHPDEASKNAALNLLGMFFGFGALLLPFVIGSLLGRLGLAPILSTAAVLCAGLAAWCACLRFPPAKQAAGVSGATILGFLRLPVVWGFALLLFCESGNEFLLGGYISTYLAREIHLTLSSASYALAGFWAAIMLSRVLASRLLLRVPGHRVVLLSAAVSALASAGMALAGSATTAIVAVAALGFSLAGIYPTTLGLAGARFAQHSGTVFGILFTVALAGGMTLPWAVGQAANAYGMRLGLGIAPASFLVILTLAAAIPKWRTP
ncbi:MAG TPA: MFS transporter [Bryobacteraceae bacterium]|nr:MFS transporter [Bryobacteraceae bacterium]